MAQKNYFTYSGKQIWYNKTEALQSRKAKPCIKKDGLEGTYSKTLYLAVVMRFGVLVFSLQDINRSHNKQYQDQIKGKSTKNKRLKN